MQPKYFQATYLYYKTFYDLFFLWNPIVKDHRRHPSYLQHLNSHNLITAQLIAIIFMAKFTVLDPLQYRIDKITVK